MFTSWATGEIPEDPGKILDPQPGTYLMEAFSGTDRRWPLVVWTKHEASLHHPIAWGPRGALGPREHRVSPVGTKSRGTRAQRTERSRGPERGLRGPKDPENQRTQKIQGTRRTLRTQRTKTWCFLLPPLLFSSLSSCFHSCSVKLADIRITFPASCLPSSLLLSPFHSLISEID